MISETATRHLNVSSHRKEKIELYFDIVGMINLFSSTTGASIGGGGSDQTTQSDIQ
jgi:hypothetical protein